VVACVSPADTNAEESVNTLRYANNAKNIKNKPIANKNADSSKLDDMRRKVMELEAKLAAAEAKAAPPPPSTPSRTSVSRMRGREPSASASASANNASLDRLAAMEAERDALKRQIRSLTTGTGSIKALHEWFSSLRVSKDAKHLAPTPMLVAFENRLVSFFPSSSPPKPGQEVQQLLLTEIPSVVYTDMILGPVAKKARGPLSSFLSLNCKDFDMHVEFDDEPQRQIMLNVLLFMAISTNREVIFEKIKNKVTADGTLSYVEDGILFTRYELSGSKLKGQDMLVWYEPDADGKRSGSICWVSAGEKQEKGKHNYANLGSFTDIYVGKQTPLMKHNDLAAVDQARCITLASSKISLDLVSKDADALSKWLYGIKSIVTNAGRTVAVNAASDSKEAAAQILAEYGLDKVTALGSDMLMSSATPVSLIEGTKSFRTMIEGRPVWMSTSTHSANQTLVSDRARGHLLLVPNQNLDTRLPPLPVPPVPLCPPLLRHFAHT
jgi:hypothetical protein